MLQPTDQPRINVSRFFAYPLREKFYERACQEKTFPWPAVDLLFSTASPRCVFAAQLQRSMDLSAKGLWSIDIDLVVAVLWELWKTRNGTEWNGEFSKPLWECGKSLRDSRPSLC